MSGQVLVRSRPPRRPTPVQLLMRLVMARSLRQAATTAKLLDRLVDRDLALLRGLPVHERARPVEKLAELVMLAQAYRHYANGWIGRRELRRRSRATFDRLAAFIVDG
ncbi:MAG TPA: hypothetical protein VGJ95_20045 [Pseudonocardiaceae bacterium]